VAQLLRVRRRIAEAKPTGLTASDVSFLVVEKKRSGASVAKALAVDDLGQVSGWPKGFLEEATRERIDLLSSIASRLEDK